MKPTQKVAALLEQLGAVQRMERGKVCQMKARKHFNHQTWEHGRNHVRYVPQEEVADLRAAIEGYGRFMKLVHQYADEIILLTRCQHAQKYPKHPLKRPD